MMNDLNIPFFRKTMFAGMATLFLSTGVTQANPVSAGEEVTEKHAAALPLQKKVTITGVVKDALGPVVGANVVEKGTTNGTVTDMEGRFSLQVSSNAVLIISYIGYIDQAIPVNGKSSFTVLLKEDSQALDEVVVVGYGTQKKVNMTGAVASVDMSKMVDSRPITSLSAGLAGMAPGVSVAAGNGGRPGNDGATIRVRGQGTLNDSNPLVIIDGVEASMNNINPQDVESISVLKDAASSAIYGSRAANGVILITTRRGKSGEAKISYNGYVTMQKVANRIDLVSNYADYMELYNEGQLNSGLPAIFSQEKIDEWRAAGDSDPVKYPNSDWQDALFQTGWMQNHTININGGSDKIHYYISGNYMNNPGIMENSGYERYSARVNLDAEVKDWFTIGVNAYGTRGKEELGLLKTESNDNFYTYMQATTPGICYQAPDGRYGGVNNSEDDPQSSSNNVLKMLNDVKGNRTTNNIVSRFYAQLRPFKGLTIEGSYTYAFSDQFLYQQPVFHDLWNLYDNTLQIAGTGVSKVINRNNKTVRNNMDGLVRYETDIDRLNIQATVGASQEAYRNNWFEASKENLTSSELTELNAATANATATGTYSNWAMRSFFGRVNLNWDEKYLLEANLRADASSRFAKKYRWGYFPSFSLGWRMEQEAFMKDISWLNQLKLRASYGSLGNNAVGNYDYQLYYQASNYVLNDALQIGMAQRALSNAALTWETSYVTNFGVDFALFSKLSGTIDAFVLNDALQIGMAQRALSNAALTWETSYVTNFGVDFALFSKLSGTIDAFVKNTKGILIELPAPLVHGNATVPKSNAAEVRNRGVELSLNWNDKVGSVNYFVGGNFSFVKNKVTKFKGDEMSLNGTNMILEGEPINVQYVLSVDRIIQTEEDMAIVEAMEANNPDAFKQYKKPEYGDFLYKDIDGDGCITDNDKIKVGNGTNPTFTFGFNFGANWKGWDFSCILQGATGLKTYWSGLDGASYWPQVRRGNQINKTIADGRWYPGRTDATYPRLLDYTDGRNRVASDFWVQDKSYLRVKNVQLGYTVPKHLSQKLLIDNFRLYVSIDNALTFTGYKGLDPEVSGTKYPTMRLTTFGLNLTF